VGALYWDENVDQTELGVSAVQYPFGVDAAEPGTFDFVARNALRLPNDVIRDTESQSVYGLIEWSMTDQWKLSFEGRYASEKMNVTGSGCEGALGPNFFQCLFSTPDLAVNNPPGSGIYEQQPRVYTADSTTDNYFAPRALLEWAPADNLMTYASISKGVKPGGIATVASGTWMDQEPDGNLDELKFGAEDLIAYELGAKSTLLDRTLILNGAIFLQDYSDKQIPVQQINGVFQYTSIENAGEAEIYGLELDVVWQASDNVRLQGGYSYLHGEYTTLGYFTNSANAISRAGNCVVSADGNQCFVDLSGNTMEDIPEHSLVALAGYYPPLGGSGLNGLFEADVEYQSSRFNDEFNDREVASFSVTNMRVGLQTDKWDAMIYVNNVFDDDTIKSWSAGTGIVATMESTDENRAAFPGEGFSLAPPPRHWGVRANIRF
jgi:outer membrane receptor protein involved in Fe transport